MGGRIGGKALSERSRVVEATLRGCPEPLRFPATYENYVPTYYPGITNMATAVRLGSVKR